MPRPARAPAPPVDDPVARALDNAAEGPPLSPEERAGLDVAMADQRPFRAGVVVSAAIARRKRAAG
jgi:hypothetical protein